MGRTRHWRLQIVFRTAYVEHEIYISNRIAESIPKDSGLQSQRMEDDVGKSSGILSMVGI